MDESNQPPATMERHTTATPRTLRRELVQRWLWNHFFAIGALVGVVIMLCSDFAYFWGLVADAAVQSWTLAFGSLSKFGTSVLVASATWWLIRKKEGEDAMKDDAVKWVRKLKPLALLAAIVFLVHFFYLTPQRMISDHRTEIDALKAKNREIEGQLNALAPTADGITFSTPKRRRINDENTPFAYEVVVQSKTEIANFACGLVCDKEISGGRLDFIQGGSLYQSGEYSFAPKRSFRATTPVGIGPKNPWVIMLTAKEDFKIVQFLKE